MTTTIPTPLPDAPERVSAAPLNSRPGAFRREIDADGLCHLIFDQPDSAANVFGTAALHELAAHVDWLEAAFQVKGVILRSAKEKVFIAGADVKAMAHASAGEMAELGALGQRVFAAFAALPVPKVAAIHGACLGGGFELALACDVRVASDDASTRIGLPETQLGILPAWGGCTRLPRLVGLTGALDVILGGLTPGAREAEKRGLVDAVVPKERLLAAAKKLALRPLPLRPKHALTNNRLVAPLVRWISRRRLLAKTGGYYPAPERALDVVCRSVGVPEEASLLNERAALADLALRPETKNLTATFLRREKARRPSPGAPCSIERVAVVGAGTMGSGIAYWLTTKGFFVVLQDVSDAALARGLEKIRRSYDEAVRRRVLTPGEARAGLDRLVPVSGFAPLTSADLVIEAAIENLDLKRKIFLQLAERTRDDAILATNTSALPVGQILDSDRVVGLHFFNPVHRMPLVEVVQTARTSARVLEAAVGFTRAMGKLPVIVQDQPGFVVNRILLPYLLDAGELFGQGFNAATVDRAMLDFGMPMGPLRLLDEIGLDVALHVAETLAAAFPVRVTVPPVLVRLVDAGRLGRKSGHGIYRYQGRREIPPAGGVEAPGNVAERLSLLFINEAARCLEDGVAADAGTIDFAMIMGTGFAPFRGGPLRLADSLGLATVVSRLEGFARLAGPLFTPAPLLVRLARSGGAFYEESADLH